MVATIASGIATCAAFGCSDTGASPAGPVVPSSDTDIGGGTDAATAASTAMMDARVTDEAGAPDRCGQSCGWGAPLAVSPAAGNAVEAYVSSVPQGTTHLAWLQWGADSRAELWAARYGVATGWSTGRTVDAGPYHTMLPSLTSDGRGNALMVYGRNVGGSSSMHESYYGADGSWGQPVAVAAPSEVSGNGAAVMDAQGGATAYWNAGNNAWVVRRDVGGSWGAFDPIGGTAVPDTRIAGNSAGDAIVTWSLTAADAMGGFTSCAVWVRRFDAAAGWGAAELVVTVPGYCVHASPWLDEQGNAALVFVERQGDVNRVWGAFAEAGAAFASAQTIDAGPTGTVSGTALGSDSRGVVLALWYERAGKIWVSRHLRPDGWTGADQVQDTSPEQIIGLDVATTASGELLTAWTQGGASGALALWAAYADAGLAWSDPQRIGEQLVGGPAKPVVALGGKGGAMVAWVQYEDPTQPVGSAVGRVWAAHRASTEDAL